MQKWVLKLKDRHLTRWAKLKSRRSLSGHNYKALDKTEMPIYCNSSTCLTYFNVSLLYVNTPSSTPLVLLSSCFSLPRVQSGAYRSDVDPFITILPSWRSMKEVKRKWAWGGTTESAGGWQ